MLRLPRAIRLNVHPQREQVRSRALLPRIPKIIHQTFGSVESLPVEIKDSIAALIDRNPGWDYRFYDEAACKAFIEQNYSRAILDQYCRIDASYGAARADLFRYLLMYAVGGVYLDVKSTIDVPLDSLLRDDDVCVLSHWARPDRLAGWGVHYDLADDRGELQQWHIMCAPGHPLLKAVIETVLRNLEIYNPGLHGVGKHAVIRVTGPLAYTAAISPLINQFPVRFLDAADHSKMRYSIYSDLDHVRRLGVHYSQQRGSIVHLNTAARLKAQLLFGPARASWVILKAAFSHQSRRFSDR